MAPIFKSLIALAAALPFVFGAPTSRSLKIRSKGLDSEIPGRYIVVFKEDADLTAIASHKNSARRLNKRDGDPVEISAEYSLGAFKGYAVAADEAAIEELAASDEVDYIEPDFETYITATVSQSNAPYGLARISSRTKGATTYRYDDTAGQNTWAYIIDTGIRASHNQFGGRATQGISYVAGQTTDGNGHGTHVAGTIGGSTYGVAKKVNLIGVKVLNDAGRGVGSDTISALQWVADNARTNNRISRSVANLSLGSTKSEASNAAVRALWNAGVTVVVAAGNEGQDAANVSPASEPTVITVAATDSNDARGIWTGGYASNFGSVVDIFAPGTNIISAYYNSNTATATLTGTSMASPHVAGLAAYLISLENLATPAAVLSRLLALSTTGVVTGLNGSPNRLAFNGVA